MPDSCSAQATTTEISDTRSNNLSEIIYQTVTTQLDTPAVDKAEQNDDFCTSSSGISGSDQKSSTNRTVIVTTQPSNTEHKNGDSKHITDSFISTTNLLEIALKNENSEKTQTKEAIYLNTKTEGPNPNLTPVNNTDSRVVEIKKEATRKTPPVLASEVVVKQEAIKDSIKTKKSSHKNKKHSKDKKRSKARSKASMSEDSDSSISSSLLSKSSMSVSPEPRNKDKKASSTSRHRSQSRNDSKKPSKSQKSGTNSLFL